MTTSTRKIGQNRGRSRLWIEGKLLIEAGFNHGDLWDLHYSHNGFFITKSADGKRKISGKTGRPVIDIVGSSLGILGEEPQVLLEYIEGDGIIKVSKIP